MAKVFVTGADGMLGSNVVRELLNRKHQVVAFVQTGRNPITLGNLKIEFAFGDITNTEDVILRSKGCDYCIHIAAVTDPWPAKGNHFYSVNVGGTENIIQAVLQHHMKRLIHVSSACCFKYGTLHQPGNEATAISGDQYGLDYIQSKMESHKKVLYAIKNLYLPAVIVCPTFMIGPFDTKPGSGKLVLAIAKGKLPALPPGGRNWVDARDVAWAICNSLEMGQVGECYILGGENLYYRDAVRRMASAIKQHNYPKKVVSAFAIKLIGVLNDAFAFITGKAPVISYKMARIACDTHFYNSDKAIRELGLKQRCIEYAAIELNQWFKTNGYL